MPNKCRDAFEKGAKKVIQLPADYDDLHVKDTLPKQIDWDDLNTSICEQLREVDCMIGESELDPFWEENNTFGGLIKYIEENCNC